MAKKSNRKLIIGIGVALLVAVVIAIVALQGDDTGSSGSASIAAVPSGVISTPGSKTSAKYRRIQEKANREGTLDAEKQGGTFIPTIVGSVSEKSETKLGQVFNEEDGKSCGNCCNQCNQDTFTRPEKYAFSDLLEDQPQLGELFAANPGLARLVKQSPHMARLLANNPQLGKILAANPDLANLVARSPHLSKLLESNPQLAKIL